MQAKGALPKFLYKQILARFVKFRALVWPVLLAHAQVQKLASAMKLHKHRKCATSHRNARNTTCNSKLHRSARNTTCKYAPTYKFTKCHCVCALDELTVVPHTQFPLLLLNILSCSCLLSSSSFKPLRHTRSLSGGGSHPV